MPTRQSGAKKKTKLTPEQIKAALEAKAAQKKSYLDQYYGKYMDEQRDRAKIDERETKGNELKKEVSLARKKLYRIQSKGDMVAYKPYRAALIEDMRESTAHANDPVITEKSRRAAYSLHLSDPDYWTPLRLSALFKCNPIRMRSLLYSSKLQAQEIANGVVFDDTVEDGLASIFGEVEFPDTFDGRPPDEIMIKKVHNPWYYINPAIKSGELLKFVRSRETIHYREASRVPAQPLEPVRYFQERLASGVPAQRKIPHGKKSHYMLFDSSPKKHIYNRLFVVRDTDGQWRTGNWAERRKLHDWRRHLKFPFKMPFAWPDESQPDKVPVSAKPPPSFRVQFDNEKEISFAPGLGADE